MFGDFVKKIRLEKRITLHELCINKTYDPSNLSKVERGLLPPPKDKDILQKWTEQLGLSSEEHSCFFDLAFIERGSIPPDIIEDKELLKELPLLFKTLREKSNEVSGIKNDIEEDTPIIENIEDEIDDEESELYGGQPVPYLKQLGIYMKNMGRKSLQRKWEIYRDNCREDCEAFGDALPTEKEMKDGFKKALAREAKLIK